MERSAEEKLAEVEEAISKVLNGGQEYRIGTKSLTRADLGRLMEMQKDLQAQVDGQRAGLMDGTYVAEFDGR